MPRLLALVGAVALGLAAAPTAAELHLPPALATYRQWAQLFKEPLGVSYTLWIQCMAPTPADWARQTAVHGPHTQHYIRVYGNETASTFLASGRTWPLPAGAIVAKEKLGQSPDGVPVGAAFMIKRGGAAFADSGGWEFLYYPASGDARRTHEACAACHRGAKSRDYIFGTYPK
jgi:hypothetical protein